MSNLSRRDAIRRMAIMFGGTIAIPDVLKAWETPQILNEDVTFSAIQRQLIAEIAEVIIPTTDTPGAKAAGVPAFIEKMIADCYTKEARDYFFKELDTFEAENKFLAATDKFSILKKAESDAVEARKKYELVKQSFGSGVSTLPQPQPMFDMMKELTVVGYFTSEIGCTQALRYEQVPGKYDGNAPYKKGDRAYQNF